MMRVLRTTIFGFGENRLVVVRDIHTHARCQTFPALGKVHTRRAYIFYPEKFFTIRCKIKCVFMCFVFDNRGGLGSSASFAAKLSYDRLVIVMPPACGFVSPGEGRGRRSR